MVGNVHQCLYLQKWTGTTSLLFFYPTTGLLFHGGVLYIILVLSYYHVEKIPELFHHFFFWFFAWSEITIKQLNWRALIFQERWYFPSFKQRGPKMTQSWPKHNRFLTFTENWIITFGWNGLKRRTKLSSKLLSSMENIRERLSLSGVSGTAYSLIAHSRRSSSTGNYESVWRKWVGWCRRRHIDPV